MRTILLIILVCVLFGTFLGYLCFIFHKYEDFKNSKPLFLPELQMEAEVYCQIYEEIIEYLDCIDEWRKKDVNAQWHGKSCHLIDDNLLAEILEDLSVKILGGKILISIEDYNNYLKQLCDDQIYPIDYINTPLTERVFLSKDVPKSIRDIWIGVPDYEIPAPKSLNKYFFLRWRNYYLHCKDTENCVYDENKTYMMQYDDYGRLKNFFLDSNFGRKSLLNSMAYMIDFVCYKKTKKILESKGYACRERIM